MNNNRNRNNGNRGGKFAYLYDESNLKRVRKIVKSILSYSANDRKALNDLMLNRITAYECKGYDLNGSNAGTHDPRRHFLVNQNHYEVYEIPYNDHDPNDLRMTGHFLVLMKNTDFGKWYLANMTHKVIRSYIPEELVDYSCLGEFEITEYMGEISWRCTCSGGYVVNGFRTSTFDTDHVRMEEGYHTSYRIFTKKYGNGARRI